MATKTARHPDATKTASILTARLGGKVAWPFFLADSRRADPDRVAPDLYGHQLFPYGKAGNQPVYRLVDIEAFIAAVQAADPGMRPAPLTVYVYDDSPGIPWRMRRMRRCAILVKKPAIIGAPRPPRSPKVEPGSSSPAPL